jgi:hypothetical protein
LLAFAALLVFLPAPVFAAPPVGSFEIPLGGDLSIPLLGDQDALYFCQLMHGQFDEVESCGFEPHLDGKGRISGEAVVSGWVDGRFLTLEGVIRGRRRLDGRTGWTDISYFVRVDGEIGDGNDAARWRVTIDLGFRVLDRAAAIVSFSVRSCMGSGKCPKGFGAFRPFGQLDGEWTLRLEVDEAGGGRLVGLARADFADGSACLYDVSGRHDARRDVSRLRLVPTTPECEKTALRLDEISVMDGALTAWLRYALFGSRGDSIVESAPENDPP